jgi:hypothetical protein
MSRTTRTRTWLVLLAAVSGAFAGATSAVEAQESTPGANKTLVVGDDSMYRLEHRAGPVVVNDSIKHVLHQNATKKHIFSYPGLGDYELDPADPNKRSFTVTFTQVGKIYYRCKIDGLTRYVKVEPQAASTTSTTARQAIAAVPSTAPTTTTAARAAAASPASPAAGAAAAPAPAAAAAAGEQVSHIEAASVDAEEVAFHTAAEDEVDQGGTTMLILAVGFFVALLGGAGAWGWYHRSSRYLSA